MITTAEYRDVIVPTRERLHHLYNALPAFSEVCWFLVSLVLFMVLGPFAAPVALIAVFTLDSESRGSSEPQKLENT